MVVLQVVVPDQDADTWITALALEDLAERLAGLAKGTEVYFKGEPKAGLYLPEGGEPRVSLTLLASHVEPLVLERKRTARQAAGSQRCTARTTAMDTRRPAQTLSSSPSTTIFEAARR